MSKLKKLTIKSLPLFLISLILLAPFVLGAEKSLVEDGKGMRSFSDDYVEENFTAFTDMDDLKDLRYLYEDVTMAWNEGSPVSTPLSADIKSVKLDEGSDTSDIKVEMHDDLAELDGVLMTLVYLNGEYAIQSICNGTEILSASAGEDMNATITESSVSDATITLTYDNDDYNFEASDDWFVLNIFIDADDFDSDSATYTFDIVPKLGGLNMFASFFGNPMNLLLLAIFAVAIIIIWAYARYKAQG
ncbi:MAG: hypothetical protein KGY74_07100 [Candidatus Cloacimonetes bacterium]|nr:hypothetical protein [Candidatus Cloacimonadota bacterium]